ncbi:hypothetical protein A3715_15835 [Oleiphilus sp. HI0009]|nr:hypothetical protein A3715_15835 [Oleiphilus sp. HI0009]
MQTRNFESDVQLAMQFREASSDKGNAIVANTNAQLKLKPASTTNEKYWESVRIEADKRLGAQP